MSSLNLSIKMRKQPLSVGRFGKALFSGMRPAMERASVPIMHNVRANLSGRVLQRRTGRLLRSVKHEITRQKMGWRLEVFISLTEVPYARIHEYGGMAGQGRSVKIPKRPYLRKALVQSKNAIRKELADYVGKLIARAK